MHGFPKPFNEAARLEALRSLGGARAAIAPVLEQVLTLMRRLTGAPVALVSLVDEDRQCFEARQGMDLAHMPRSHAICSYTIMSDAPLIIPDTHADPRFADHPAVVNPPHVRFYAGAPIKLSSGFRVGSLCTVDITPHGWPSSETVETMQGLARIVGAAFDLDPAVAAFPVDPAAAQPASADAARAEFLSLISHELRTPLNGILGLARLLEPRLGSPADRELIDGIVTSGDHLRQIVERILEFSDIATGELQLNEQPVATRSLLETALGLTQPSALANGKTLRIGAASEPEQVYIDPPQLGLALSCLAGNAVTHGGQAIEIGCSRDSRGDVMLTVRDDGGGIEAERLPRIFQPFSAGANAMCRQSQGIGLGLPLAQRLVEMHGGRLEASHDRGWTQFAIRLPAWRGSVQPPAQRRQAG